MRKGGVVIDKGAGKEAELKKGILCMVGKDCKGLLAPGEVTSPTSAAESSLVSSPLPDSSERRGCCHLLHLMLVSLGCWLPSRCCWEEQEPWGHRELVASLVHVWSPLHKLGPEGFCGKGESLLGHVSASLSVAVAVVGCFIASRCRLLSLLTRNCTQLHWGKASLNYLTCKGYLNGKLQTPLHPPITLIYNWDPDSESFWNVLIGSGELRFGQNWSSLSVALQLHASHVPDNTGL